MLTTASGTSQYEMYRDESADPPALVCQVGKTQLRYHLSAIEAWGRARDNPVGGWYGLRKGYWGRFGMYLPPLVEELGLIELEHNPRNNRARAL